ncbi:MAG: acyltransferase [Bacteroidales bacterium]|nr:acyltransferase [Bacteroidales bacterium]
MSGLKEKLKSNEGLKKFILYLIVSPYSARPRFWVRWFVNPLVQKRKGVIRWSARLDLFPFNKFELGKHSYIEDFTTVNNGVGDLIIGANSRIGIGCTVIGPVTIGNDVMLAQNITVSGLNHNFEDVTKTIHSQGVSVAQITIEDNVWIGANSVITAGVTIGKHSVVAGGSVVTKSIPSYSVWGGTPAKPLKEYDFDKNEWVRSAK